MNKIKDYALRIDMIDDPYIRLAEAIVVRACDDYRNPKEALRGMGYYRKPTPELKVYVRSEVDESDPQDCSRVRRTLRRRENQ